MPWTNGADSPLLSAIEMAKPDGNPLVAWFAVVRIDSTHPRQPKRDILSVRRSRPYIPRIRYIRFW